MGHIPILPEILFFRTPKAFVRPSLKWGHLSYFSFHKDFYKEFWGLGVRGEAPGLARRIYEEKASFSKRVRNLVLRYDKGPIAQMTRAVTSLALLQGVSPVYSN